MAEPLVVKSPVSMKEVLYGSLVTDVNRHTTR